MNPTPNSFNSLMPSYIGSQALKGSVIDSPKKIVESVSIQDISADATNIAKRDFKKLKYVLKRTLRQVTLVFVVIFTLIGLSFTGVFIAMQFHLLDVKGSSVSRDEFFKAVPKTPVLAASVSRKPTSVSCVKQLGNGTQVPVCAWNKSEEYATVRSGLDKDKNIINKVAQETGVPARLMAASVVPEQLRWFTDDRETFKKTFEPLKILGVAAHMTYGIGGFHPATAKRVEQYAADSNSPFYAGKGMAKLIAYPSVENPSDKNTLSRLSDYKDHYYSYLYVALFIKEITNQWASAGYDISNRPDVIATLYNIGFDKSVPKTNPQIGGADIRVGRNLYSYGELGTDFYNSEELTKIFPMQY